MQYWHGHKNVFAPMNIVLTLVLAGLPLAAVNRGATVEATMADGSKARGELLAVKSDALLVYNHDSGRGENLDLQQVIRVKLFRKSKALPGLAIGLGVGLGMGVLIPHEHYNNAVTHVILPLYSSFAGAILGIFSCLPRSFSLAEISPLAKQAKLDRLGRYAREQNGEKSAK